MDNELKVPNQINGAVDVEEAFSGFPEVAVPRNIRKSVKWDDHFCYIFTSGTTGLPKAAVGDHGRYTLGSMIALVLAGMRYYFFVKNIKWIESSNYNHKTTIWVSH